MKPWKQVFAVAAAAAMVLASGEVLALGLGVPNTRAMLGETLRMTIPLELESGEDADDGCPQAEVFYGDSRIDAGKVILGVSPQSGRHRVMSVRVVQSINEPLVEVTVSYGCAARLQRKFTVFASPPEFVPTVVLRPATSSAPYGSERDETGPRTVVLSPSPSAQTAMGTSTGAGDSARDRAPPPRIQRAAPARGHTATSSRNAKVVPAPQTPPPESRMTAPSAAPVPAAVPASAPAPVVKPAAAASAAAPQASAALPKKSEPAKPTAGPRLMLDPVTPMAATLPGAGASDAASGVQPNLVTSQAGSDMDRLQAQLAQDRQRLDEMAQRITQLRQDAVQAKAAASGVGLNRPAGLDSATHPIWLIIVSAVAVLALLLSAYLFMHLRRQERANAWWSDPDSR